jgi:toxin ParE1/3/4
MLTLRWLPSARSDLNALIDYIAERDENAAFRLWSAIEDAVNKIPQRPELYRKGRVEGTRELVVHPNYIAIYQISGDAIEVVAIMHAHQQYPR